MYRIRWWIAGLLARLYTLGLFKKVEVAGESIDLDGPRLIVANHFGGLVDAIVVVRALGGLPHIVAKSTLFDRLPLRLLLRALGVVPVYRRVDHTDASKNRGSFDEVADVLAKGRAVLIFPEGTVTDTQELQAVRTGAARMALTAIERGTTGLEIIPLGITYEDKVSSRSRVLVEVGGSIGEDDIRAVAGDGELSAEDHGLVRSVTDSVRTRLREVAPDFGSFIRERTMMLAASIHLRTSMTEAFAEPTVYDLRTAAQSIGNATRGDEWGLPQTADYQLALAASGLEDHRVQPRPTVGSLTRVVFRKSLIVLVLAPLALFGLLVNLIPLLLVLAVGAFIKEPVSKGTARVIAGVVGFPVVWGLEIALTNPDPLWLAIVLLLASVIALVITVGQLADLAEAVIDWWTVRNHLGLLPELAGLRGKAEEELARLLAGST